MQVIIPACYAGSSFAADVYLAVAVSLKTSSNPITAGSGWHMGSEVTWSHHHADFPQGVIVRVFPRVPNNAIRTQRPPGFKGVAASLPGKKRVMMEQIWPDRLLVDTHPVVKAIEVGVEALAVPPTAVGDFSTDVSAVGGAEALLVVVPAERVLNRSTEAWHVQAVLVLLILHATNTPTRAVSAAGTNRYGSRRCRQPPESLVEGMLVLVAPVLQVDPEAVLSLGAQLVYVFVAQPELWVQVAETIPVVPPVPVKAHWAVDTPLDHSPAAPFGAEEASCDQRTAQRGGGGQHDLGSPSVSMSQ